MRLVLALSLVILVACTLAGCRTPDGESAAKKEFKRLYEEYSDRFHEKMIKPAKGMTPAQITAEAARIWDDVFAGHQDVIDARVKEILDDLDDAQPVTWRLACPHCEEPITFSEEPEGEVTCPHCEKTATLSEDLTPQPMLGDQAYVRIASGKRREPAEGQPTPTPVKQFLWNPVGTAQMSLNNWLARVLEPQSFALRRLLTANAGLFWKAVDRDLNHPTLQMRQGPLVFTISLTREKDYYQVEKLLWIRPESMGPIGITEEGKTAPAGETPTPTGGGGEAAPATTPETGGAEPAG